jgi:hypothetical protein
MTAKNVEPHAGHLIGTFGSFTFTLVRRGEAYGLKGCLTHDREDPLVEVYDARYAGKPGFTTAGQFISRYYLSTLRKHTGGLSLHGGVPEWTLSAATFEAARVAIERFLNP